jgi:hypothetical protein
MDSRCIDDDGSQFVELLSARSRAINCRKAIGDDLLYLGTCEFSDENDEKLLVVDLNGLRRLEYMIIQSSIDYCSSF